MKFPFKLLSAALLVISASCNETKVVPGTYVDLNTGKPVNIVADPVTGYATNSNTNKPVYIYIDNKKDTVFTTGLVVNSKLILLPNGKYEVDETKVKIDSNLAKIKHQPHE